MDVNQITKIRSKAFSFGECSAILTFLHIEDSKDPKRSIFSKSKHSCWKRWPCKSVDQGRYLMIMKSSNNKTISSCKLCPRFQTLINIYLRLHVTRLLLN